MFLCQSNRLSFETEYIPANSYPGNLQILKILVQTEERAGRPRPTTLSESHIKSIDLTLRPCYTMSTYH